MLGPGRGWRRRADGLQLLSTWRPRSARGASSPARARLLPRQSLVPRAPATPLGRVCCPDSPSCPGSRQRRAGAEAAAHEASPVAAMARARGGRPRPHRCRDAALSGCPAGALSPFGVVCRGAGPAASFPRVRGAEPPALSALLQLPGRACRLARGRASSCHPCGLCRAPSCTGLPLQLLWRGWFCLAPLICSVLLFQLQLSSSFSSLHCCPAYGSFVVLPPNLGAGNISRFVWKA